MKLKLNLALLSLSFLSIEICPDTFLLKDGKKIYGTQVERTKNEIIYKNAKEEIKSIPIENIKSITINNTITKEQDKETMPTLEELREKVWELSAKIDNLTAEKKEEVSIDLTQEVVSDFIWRGNSYGGEYLSRRNNMPYSGTTQYWAYQPNIRLNAPIKGLYMEFWGNFALVGREDRDSDMRLFQASPGGQAIDPNVYFGKLSSINADSSINNIQNSGIFYDPPNGIVNSKCVSDGKGSCNNPDYSFVDPRRVGKNKEKNGMARTDGLFTTFAYNFQNKKFGDITWGIWFYYQMDKNAKYSWEEYFIFWGLPFLEESIKPTISLYTQSSFENDGIYAGGHYLSLTLSHTFFEDKFFKIQPATNLGYKYQNNNIDQKSGFYDLTTNLKFFFGDFFISLNHAYRPNLYMYDNDTWYYTVSQGTHAQPNRSQYDGKTIDPSKLYGVKNEAIYSAINQLDTIDPIKNYLKESYQSQKIVQNLFYISFGYNMKF